MLAAVQVYDATLYHCLRVVYRNESSPLKFPFEQFIEQMEENLTGPSEARFFIDQSMDKVWELRLKALNWIIDQGEDFFALLQQEVVPRFEDMLNSGKMGLLADNVLFALRCNERFLKGMFGESGIEKFAESLASTSIPETSLAQTFTALLFSTPNKELAETIISWLKSSLDIEYVILAAAIIDEKKLDVSQAMLDNLASVIADAAQTYSAIPMEKGWITARPLSNFHVETENGNISAEEQILAETGLATFAQTWY